MHHIVCFVTICPEVEATLLTVCAAAGKSWHAVTSAK